MRLLEKSNTLKVLDIIKESDEYTGQELDDTAKWVYEYTNREDEWDKFTDNELIELISFCCITEKNPWGRPYDDEVFDAADRRPNGEELVRKGQLMAVDGDASKLKEDYKGNIKEPIKVKLYDEWQEYPSIEAAKEEMLDAMSSCDPGSHEYSRYAFVLQQLMQGETTCYDDINDIMELNEALVVEYLEEAENPENKEINSLIKALLTGRTSAKRKLEKMGYTIEFDDDAYKQFGKDYFGKYIKITNNKTGKQLVASYGSKWGQHDFISAKPVEDNSASSNPVKKQQWHNSFHKLTGKTHPSDKMANPNKFDYKGYLDKETPDLSEPESEFQRFKKDKAYLKDKEYEAKRIDAARERVANIRAKLGKGTVEESLKEGYDVNEPNSMDNVRKHLENKVGGSILVGTYTNEKNPAQDPPTKDDIGKVEYDLRVWDDGSAEFEKYVVVEDDDPENDHGTKWESTADFIPGDGFDINFTDEEVDKWAQSKIKGLNESLKEESIIDVKYIGKDGWDRHLVKDPKTGKFYGDTNLTTVGKDKDLSMASWHTYSGNDPYDGEPEMPIGDDIKFNIVNPDEIPSDYQRFEYSLLSRLESDCKYFLGNGNGYEGHLWAGSVDKQIAKMKELYNQLEEKPEWITMEDIDNYEKQMKEFVPKKGE